MAVGDFTDTEKAAIRSYLGFSALYYQIDPRLESQIGSGGLGSAQPAEAARVRASLAQLADIETRLTSALDNLPLTKAEDINFLGPQELEALRSHGRTIVNQLAIVFELTPKADYFGEGAGGMGGLSSVG